MINLSNYLQKFSTLLKSGQEVKEKTIVIIDNICGCSLSVEAITVKDNTIFITAPPHIKSEIFMKKSHILKQLQEEPLLKGITVIR